MKGLIIVMGTSGSGKSTLEQRLINEMSDTFYKIVSFTTRQPRTGEIDGKDYHFVRESDFHLNSDAGTVFQWTKFADNFYGSYASEFTKFEDKYGVLVAAPSDSFMEFLYKYNTEVRKPVYTVYFDISQKRLYDNMVGRGDHPKDVADRLKKDNIIEESTRLNIKKDFVVTDEMLDENLLERVTTFLTERGNL
jgi:guanylate kinase